MKVLKYVLIGLASLIVLALIVGFLSPQHVVVERSAVIGASQEKLFKLLQDPKVFQEWSPWVEMDSTIKVTYTGPSTGVGAGYSWIGEATDEGTWIIKTVKPNSLIEVDITFGDEGGGVSSYILEPSGEGTKLTWKMDADMGSNPIGKLFGFVVKGMLGPQYERGLELLDEYVKTIPKGRVDKIEEQTSPSFAMLSIRAGIEAKNIGGVLADSYGKIVAFINENSLQMSAPPFAIYHAWPEGGAGKADVEAAIPIATSHTGNENIKGSMFQGGPIVIAHYYGDFEDSELAHIKLQEWAKANGKTLGKTPWEVYVTDPQAEPDPMKWLTLVCYRIVSPGADA